MESLCLDIEFMLGVKTSFYWRACWGFITPALMITVFIYGFISYEALTFGEDYVYPAAGYGIILIFYLKYDIGDGTDLVILPMKSI